MVVPALFLGITGLVLMVFQPGPAAMDLLSWIWPPALAVLAVWMILQVRRNLRGRGRWLVLPVIATLLLVAVGGAFATVSAATRGTAQTAAGQMVDVGGHRLYIECTGSGEPDRRPPGGARRVVLLMGKHRAEGRRVDKGLRLRPRGPRP